MQAVVDRYDTLNARASDVDNFPSPQEYAVISKELSDLGPAKEALTRVLALADEIDSARVLVEEGEATGADSDARELAEMAREELRSASRELEGMEEEVMMHLLPRDDTDNKDVIIEIRPGAGGDEAMLFVEDLLGMYTKFAGVCGWTAEVLERSYGSGGVRAATVAVRGPGAFGRLKFESGVHRVQRVPATESAGRLHTSTVTVAVLPEAEEVDITINPADVRLDTFRASGAGGQHVNKTDSAVRLKHIPTGTTVSCQDDRSQHVNKDKAWRMLRAKLFAAETQRRQEERSGMRTSQIGSGDRSERIRTYNFPQSRVTDHRVNFSANNIQQVTNGDGLNEIIDVLCAQERLEKLQILKEDMEGRGNKEAPSQ